MSETTSKEARVDELNRILEVTDDPQTVAYIWARKRELTGLPEPEALSDEEAERKLIATAMEKLSASIATEGESTKVTSVTK